MANRGISFASVAVTAFLGSATPGCHEGEWDGAVVRVVSVDRLVAGSEIIFIPDRCMTVIRGTGHRVDSRYTTAILAFHASSFRGKVRTKVYIRPEGAPPDFDLTTENGELVDEYVLHRASFLDVDIVEDTFTTHDGDTVTISFFFTEDCEEIEYPEGLKS